MWTKSACVVLAWSILLIVLVAICRQGSVRQAQANIRIASSAQVTLTSTVDAVSTSARATGPARKYVVQQGDTLSGIAAALAMRGGWPALYAADRRVIGPDPDVIRPGTVLTVPGPAAAAAPRPAPPASKPSAHGHPARPSRPRPVRTTAAAAGMPQGLKILLLAAGLVIGLVFLVELMLVARRQHEIRLRTPGPGQLPANETRIVMVDYDRVVVTWSEPDATIVVLRPPGEDPKAILSVARLVLPEARYAELADALGMPASWPIVMADYHRVVVTCSKPDDTILVLRPPGEDPRAVLRVARLVLAEGAYGELADQLGEPANWPME